MTRKRPKPDDNENTLYAAVKQLAEFTKPRNGLPRNNKGMELNVESHPLVGKKPKVKADVVPFSTFKYQAKSTSESAKQTELKQGTATVYTTADVLKTINPTDGPTCFCQIGFMAHDITDVKTSNTKQQEIRNVLFKSYPPGNSNVLLPADLLLSRLEHGQKHRPEMGRILKKCLIDTFHALSETRCRVCSPIHAHMVYAGSTATAKAEVAKANTAAEKSETVLIAPAPLPRAFVAAAAAAASLPMPVAAKAAASAAAEAASMPPPPPRPPILCDEDQTKVSRSIVVDDDDDDDIKKDPELVAMEAELNQINRLIKEHRVVELRNKLNKKKKVLLQLQINTTTTAAVIASAASAKSSS